MTFPFLIFPEKNRGTRFPDFHFLSVRLLTWRGLFFEIFLKCQGQQPRPDDWNKNPRLIKDREARLKYLRVKSRLKDKVEAKPSLEDKVKAQRLKGTPEAQVLEGKVKAQLQCWPGSSLGGDL